MGSEAGAPAVTESPLRAAPARVGGVYPGFVGPACPGAPEVPSDELDVPLSEGPAIYRFCPFRSPLNLSGKASRGLATAGAAYAVVGRGAAGGAAVRGPSPRQSLADSVAPRRALR
ncbi:hypothetical protein Q7C36_012117 [Tachysurus vachellii]|uniref:Uncharacterized protein n=1 Tax=Tachysurus vachellii TaxID=175792 RepID=A0AA88SPT9_TACVA|nr:hypothetical protein Q7C36_012117 [Tachysurus vachellii]